MIRIPYIVCVLAIATSLVGCGRRVPPAVVAPPPPVVDAPPPPPPPPPVPAVPAPEPAVPTEDELFARKTVEQLNAEGPLGTVHFDYDRADLDEDARAILAKNAEWLNRWRSVRITIEGHCDERGTAEYNIALGDRRAQSVRAYLVSLGIDASRLTVVSKGKEVPVCTDASEGCWQQNRRAPSVITAK